MATSIYAENLGKIDSNYANVGYYILTVIISEIANISYDVIPLLPFQSIPLILILVAILRNITYKNNAGSLIIIAIMLVFITKFGNKSFFMYWSHGLGFLLSILVLLMVILRFKSKQKNQSAVSVILILTIVSLNYISYKATSFTILLLVGFQISEWLYRYHFNPNEKKNSLMTIIIIGFVYILTFNKMFYNSFIPRIISTSESTSGTYKLMQSFQEYQFDPLNDFYFSYPIGIRNALTIWVVLILFGLLLMVVNLFQEFMKKQNLHIRNKIIVGLIMSSSLMFIIYNSLGLSDFTYIVISSYICYVVLYTNKIESKKYRHFIIVIIISLLALNCYMSISLTNANYYNGLRDNNDYQYLNAPSNWHMNYVINVNLIEGQMTAADVFTGGYFAKEIAKENIPSEYAPRVFSYNNMLFMFNINSEVPKSKYRVFVINYKLKYFSADNWQNFKSWLNYKQLLDNNHGITNIYSSGDIDIFSAP